MNATEYRMEYLEIDEFSFHEHKSLSLVDYVDFTVKETSYVSLGEEACSLLLRSLVIRFELYSGIIHSMVALSQHLACAHNNLFLH